MTPGRPCLWAAILALPLAWSGRAAAQVRWDLGVLAGVTDRFTSGDRAAPAPTPGPSAEVHAHLAVLPMLRVGPYAAFDWSPASGAPARQIYAAGLRAKVAVPVLSAPWRAWAFAGAGFADAYTPVKPRSQSIAMVELPFGMGLGHKLHGPWEIVAELGARLVVARAAIQTADTGGSAAPLVRDDLLAVSLSVGVSLAP
jgi:hypothetical protein